MDIGAGTPWSPAMLIAGLTLLASVLWLWPNHYRPRVLSVLRRKRHHEPSRDGRTFRVRGVPTEWERHHLRDALRDRFSEVEVASLAPEMTGHSSTATVVFRGDAPSVRGVNGSVTLPLPAATSGSPSSPGLPPREQSLTLDVSLFGMTTIYAPPENDHKVDVIAISGLGGHSLGSFKQRHGEHMWLRDSLPRHITDEATSQPMARIMTYGYESRLQDSESMQNIEDLATAFHSSILPLVSSPRMKPIIFIAHSLGGLIVKQALITLSRSKSEDDQRLLQAVYGVAFFGVPHDGMDITSLIPIAGDGPNRALVDSLSRVNSLILSMQQRDFHRALGQEGETEIICFYETLQSPTAQKDKRGQWAMDGPPAVLVTKASATHCRPWEDGPEHICAIARTHSEMVKFGPGDPEYDRVCQRLKGLARRSIKGGPRRRAVLGTKFMVPFLQNASFVGRRDLFENVRRRIAIERRPGTASSWPRVVLHGLGGVGKTQIAIEYAYWVYANCPEVSMFWVHASSAERFRESLANIAEECGIPGHDDPKVDVLTLVKRWLERNTTRWLMIIDNADDGQLFGPGGSLLQAIPECNHGSILATTRNKQAGMALSMGQQVIEVGALNDLEASELLAAGIPAAMSTPDDLSDLARHLECLPLALAQASAFINTQTITAAEYLHLLRSGDRGFAALLDEDFSAAGRDAGSSHAVSKTWILSFEQIGKSDALAADFLSLMSCLDRHAIPRDMLRVFSQRRKGDKSAVDDVRLTKAIGLLQAFSFVTRGRDETLDMHRLVQLVTRKWLAARERDVFFAGQALLAVSKLFPPVNYDTLRTCRSYLAHAHAVRENRGTGSKDEILARARILTQMSLYLSYQGEWNAAAPLSLEATDIWKGALPADHPNTLNSMTDLADIYCNQGRWADAESILLRVCEARARTLGEDHPDTLAAQAILASTYWAQGRWDDSEVIERRVLATRRRVLGEDNLSTVESMANLAATCDIKGQWKEAELMRGRVYATARRVLGQQHPFTLDAGVEMAISYLHTGRYEEAEELLKQTLTASRTVRGEEHPRVMVCMGELGQCYHIKGMLKEAETLYERVLTRWQDALGPEHPEILRCSIFLVRNYAAQQRWEEAEALGKRVVEATERVCGPQHPNTLESTAALVEVYVGEGRWADAELLGRQVLENRTRKHGEAHPATLQSASIMSRVFCGTGRWEEAEALGTRALNARLAVLGADHLKTLESLGHLGSIYSSQQRWEDAQDTFSQLLTTQKEALGEDHPDTVKTMAVLALAFSEGGHHDEATALNLQVIEARKRLQGEDDPETLMAMANQAFVYTQCGEWEEALSLGTQALHARKRVLGQRDPVTLTSMSNLAFTLRGMGRAQEALSLMQRCAHLRMETLGWEHPDTEVSMQALDAWMAEDQAE